MYSPNTKAFTFLLYGTNHQYKYLSGQILSKILLKQSFKDHESTSTLIENVYELLHTTEALAVLAHTVLGGSALVVVCLGMLADWITRQNHSMSRKLGSVQHIVCRSSTPVCMWECYCL